MSVIKVCHEDGCHQVWLDPEHGSEPGLCIGEGATAVGALTDALNELQGRADDVRDRLVSEIEAADSAKRAEERRAHGEALEWWRRHATEVLALVRDRDCAGAQLALQGMLAEGEK